MTTPQPTRTLTQDEAVYMAKQINHQSVSYRDSLEAHIVEITLGLSEHDKKAVRELATDLAKFPA